MAVLPHPRAIGLIPVMAGAIGCTALLGIDEPRVSNDGGGGSDAGGADADAESRTFDAMVDGGSDSGSAPDAGSMTFAFTGSNQVFTVPPGIAQLFLVVAGAAGGKCSGAASPGLGGLTRAAIAVTPGETLTIVVGGAGGGCGVSGGFNGGAKGGTRGGAGGDGGGASDVRQAGSGLANRVVIAGGGGGGGGNAVSGTGSAGGAGGGASATSGGGGGTQTTGGAAGGNGSAGTLGIGGDGGLAPALTADGSGGGGGGGLYGGGGGGGNALSGGNGGGGGGGSSYADPSATGVTMEQGTQAGDGQVVVSW